MSTVFKPHIGKNVIETLTLGMYEDPRFIYREYIQNSADQIDIAVEEGILNSRIEGEIELSIDRENRIISIYDNATGVKTDKIRRFLGDVANSEKDLDKRKGFRGIGRLGGLGYCDKLVFETSFKGEGYKSTMTLNASHLKDIINNNADNSDASSVISIITNIEKSEESIGSHYFKVSLFGVTNDLILDIEAVEQYVSMVAPLPFSNDFKFKDKIKKHFKSKNYVFEEYIVRLNKNQLFKAYKNSLDVPKSDEKPEITSVGFFDVRNEFSELFAIGWYGISSKVNNVIDKINYERGIRIKKNNITIGNEQTLYKMFKADRTNLRYIGEVHIVSNGFIPNARRDYFNDNTTLKEFEKSLISIFSDFENKLPHVASNLHNRLKSVNDCRTLINTYKQDKASFRTNAEQEQRANEILASFQTAEQAIKKIDKIKTEAETNPHVRDLFNSIVGDNDYYLSDEELSELFSDRVFPPFEFNKVTQEQADILNEVVIFLQTELGYKAANSLISKLQKKYN